MKSREMFKPPTKDTTPSNFELKRRHSFVSKQTRSYIVVCAVENRNRECVRERMSMMHRTAIHWCRLGVAHSLYTTVAYNTGVCLRTFHANITFAPGAIAPAPYLLNHIHTRNEGTPIHASFLIVGQNYDLEEGAKKPPLCIDITQPEGTQKYQ